MRVQGGTRNDQECLTKLVTRYRELGHFVHYQPYCRNEVGISCYQVLFQIKIKFRKFNVETT